MTLSLLNSNAPPPGPTAPTSPPRPGTPCPRSPHAGVRLFAQAGRLLGANRAAGPSDVALPSEDLGPEQGRLGLAAPSWTSRLGLEALWGAEGRPERGGECRGWGGESRAQGEGRDSAGVGQEGDRRGEEDGAGPDGPEG